MYEVGSYAAIDDIDEALAHTRAEFGARQVPVYERLIVEGRLTGGGIVETRRINYTPHWIDQIR